jgi:hypothetical protein
VWECFQEGRNSLKHLRGRVWQHHLPPGLPTSHIQTNAANVILHCCVTMCAHVMPRARSARKGEGDLPNGFVLNVEIAGAFNDKKSPTSTAYAQTEKGP